jgi:glycosyltransferase involved in cell wall biosynthesis
VLSVIIPAHNEATVIGRLLRQLLGAAKDGELDILVVANGCTDETAGVAAAFGPLVRVISTPVASKRNAIAVGNRAARGFPRFYVDADVELGIGDVRELGRALQRPGILGVGPELTLEMAGRRWPVRWYYDIWTRLPEVRRGLFGRGVVGVSEAGYARLAALPPLLADDLAASLAFSPAERSVVPNARVTVHPPLTFAALLRVRTRAVMTVNQLESTKEAPRSTARTRLSDILALAQHDLRLAPRAVLFMAVALLARARARRMAARKDSEEWLRDESSRLDSEVRYLSPKGS